MNRCRSEEQLASLEVALSPEVVPSAPTASANPTAGLGWREAWPAKLTAEAVAKLREEFEPSYPTELLDQDSFPSSRLLALAARIQASKEVRWIPWKFRLSSRAQDDHLLLRPKKVPRLSEQSRPATWVPLRFTTGSSSAFAFPARGRFRTSRSQRGGSSAGGQTCLGGHFRPV